MIEKPHILLDLDQTLISAEALEEWSLKDNKAKAKKFKFHDMDGYYIIFERPGLQDFLTFLFANYTVSIWTAASKSYCLFVIDKIILANHPERKIDYVFFSYHCDVSSKLKNGTKDISLLADIFKLPGYSKENTVILDDYDEVYKTQPENCIIAKPFEFMTEGSENDDFLVKLTETMKSCKEKNENILACTKKINSS